MGTTRVPFSIRFWSKVDVPARNAGCWMWRGYTDQDGYGRFTAEGKRERAHRVAYALEVGPIPEGIEVLHRCDTPGCVKPRHLFLGTKVDNRQDCVRKQRHARGRRVQTAKLTRADVLEIRRRAKAGELPRRIAQDYPVARRAIAKVISRKTWKHVA